MIIKKNKINRRRLLVILMTVVLVIGLLPTVALAAEDPLITPNSKMALPAYEPVIIKALDITREYNGEPLAADFEIKNLPSQVKSAYVYYMYESDRPTIIEPSSRTIGQWDWNGYVALDESGKNIAGTLGYGEFEGGKLTVTKRKVTLTVVGNNVMTVGGELPKLDVEVTSGSFLQGDAPTKYDFSISGDTNVAGEYNIVLDVDYPNVARLEKYYDVTIETGTMVVAEPVAKEPEEDPTQDITVVPPDDSVVTDPIVPEPVVTTDPVAPENPVIPANPVNSIAPVEVGSVVEVSDTSVLGSVTAPLVAVDNPAMQIVAENIEEAPVPLAQVPEVQPEESVVPEEASEVIEIEDVEAPLAAPPIQSGWALWNLIFAIAAGIIMAVLLMGYFLGKKRRMEEREVRRNGIIRLLSIVVTLVSTIVFILTEDMSQAMTMADQWTVWMAIIAIVQAGVMIFAKKTKNGKTMDAQPMNN